MKKDLKEEVVEFFYEVVDPESVKDVCMPDCKMIFEGGSVLYGQLAYKRQLVKHFNKVCEMGMNGLKMSNFQEGGTHMEPWCRYLFTYHNDEGYVYRKGKALLVFKRVEGNIRMQLNEWSFDDITRNDWNI